MPRDIRTCNTQFVLFGASGDLASCLVVPALFNLHLDHQLPRCFLLWGLGQHDWRDEEFIDHLRKGVAAHSRRGTPPEEAWQAFAANIRYLRADLTDDGAYRHLRDLLDAAQRDWEGKVERVFYLAVPPDLFRPVAGGLGRAGLNTRRDCERIVVEKPLGRDLTSFRAIDAALRSSSPSPRSSASTTSSARRPCRTSSPCASPIPSLSRSGTAATSTT